jgi:hypothetical protein
MAVSFSSTRWALCNSQSARIRPNVDSVQEIAIIPVCGSEVLSSELREL